MPAASHMRAAAYSHKVASSVLTGTPVSLSFVYRRADRVTGPERVAVQCRVRVSVVSPSRAEEVRTPFSAARAKPVNDADRNDPTDGSPREGNL